MIEMKKPNKIKNQKSKIKNQKETTTIKPTSKLLP